MFPATFRFGPDRQHTDQMSQSASPPGDRRLRIGLLLDSLRQPQWVGYMLEQVRALPFAEISLIVLNDAVIEPAPVVRRRIPIRGIIANRHRLLYELYSRLDAHRYTPASDAFSLISVEASLNNVPVLRVKPRMTRFCDYFEDADFEAICEYDLDVALRLGFRILKGKALQIARYGVWSYHHGDNARYRGGPAGFWEVMERTPVTGTILQVLTEELDDGRVIARRYGRTERNSVAINRDKCHWHSVPMVARKLADLRAHGEAALTNGADVEITPYSERLYTTPFDRELIRPLGAMMAHRVKSYARVLSSTDQWIVAYRFHGRSQRSSSVPATSFYNFKPLIPPRDRFWADPFVVVRDGRTYLFIEEYMQDTARGHIAVMEAGADGSWNTPVPVLQRPYHLSYPFTFWWEEQLFMVPESGGNRTVELYRCTEFPDAWELDTILLTDINAVDSTLIEHRGRWWMFLSIGHEWSRDLDEELSIFHAPTPRGPWTPHARNPVKTDVRSARPAGRFFEWKGNLYRPAQDCAERYGHAISLSRVLQLDETEYREVEVGRILPQWRPGLVATHTLNSAPGITVIDGLLRRPRFGEGRTSR
jgi:hypothetical protein